MSGVYFTPGQRLVFLLFLVFQHCPVQSLQKEEKNTQTHKPLMSYKVEVFFQLRHAPIVVSNVNICVPGIESAKKLRQFL
jgi:hypothetical protein